MQSCVMMSVSVVHAELCNVLYMQSCVMCCTCRVVSCCQ